MQRFLFEEVKARLDAELIELIERTGREVDEGCDASRNEILALREELQRKKGQDEVSTTEFVPSNWTLRNSCIDAF